MVDVPCDDGVVQMQIRWHRPHRNIYDPFELRHLYRSLFNYCRLGIYDESVHNMAASLHLFSVEHRCIRFIAPIVRDHPQDSFYPLVHPRRKALISESVHLTCAERFAGFTDIQF